MTKMPSQQYWATSMEAVKQPEAELFRRCVRQREACARDHRIPPKSLLLFETLLNTVHMSAPSAAIAFNTRPEDTADAVARWLNA